MKDLFSQVLNMSLTASVMIVLVILARLALKRAPKIYSYALWSVVLFRLLCPVSLPSPVSLLGALDAPVAEHESRITTVGPGAGSTSAPCGRKRQCWGQFGRGNRFS